MTTVIPYSLRGTHGLTPITAPLGVGTLIGTGVQPGPGAMLRVGVGPGVGLGAGVDGMTPGMLGALPGDGDPVGAGVGIPPTAVPELRVPATQFIPVGLTTHDPAQGHIAIRV